MRITSQSATAGEWILSVCLCLGFIFITMAFYPDLAHWFVLPVGFCGVLMAADAIRWLRGKMDIFDPVGILGLIGTHFFFLAPLLQIVLNYRTLYGRDLPEDYRPWLGGMALMNAAGLLLYRRVRRVPVVQLANVRTFAVQYGRFSVMAALLSVLSLFLYAGIMFRFGGISGFVDSVANDRTALEGLGLVLMVTESFPVVLFMWYSLTVARSGRNSWTVLAGGFLVFLVLTFLFAGLRGSRSNTAYAAIWGVGMIHFYNRKLNRGIMAGGAVLMLLFMYTYGFYKDFGKNALRMLESSEHWAAGAARSARTPELLLLGDFSRTDVHALMLYRLTDPSRNLPLAWGRTYVAAAALAIPQSIWPDRPVGKTKYLTDLEYGAGTFQPGSIKSSRVGGVSGEAMLNFGWFAAIAGPVLLGFAVRAVKRRTILWPGRDPRRLLLPYLICLLPMMLMFDSDNLVFEMAKNLLVPGTLILVSSRYCKTARVAAADVTATGGARP